MAVVSSGTAITTTPFGKVLDNTAASLNPYNVFAVTIKGSHDITSTVPFVRGYDANYFSTWPEGGWHTIYLRINNGIFVVSGRYGGDGSAGTNGNTCDYSITQIRGLG